MDLQAEGLADERRFWAQSQPRGKMEEEEEEEEHKYKQQPGRVKHMKRNRAFWNALAILGSR